MALRFAQPRLVAAWIALVFAAANLVLVGRRIAIEDRVLAPYRA